MERDEQLHRGLSREVLKHGWLPRLRNFARRITEGSLSLCPLSNCGTGKHPSQGGETKTFIKSQAKMKKAISESYQAIYVPELLEPVIASEEPSISGSNKDNERINTTESYSLSDGEDYPGTLARMSSSATSTSSFREESCSHSPMSALKTDAIKTSPENVSLRKRSQADGRETATTSTENNVQVNTTATQAVSRGISFGVQHRASTNDLGIQAAVCTASAGTMAGPSVTSKGTQNIMETSTTGTLATVEAKSEGTQACATTNTQGTQYEHIFVEATKAQGTQCERIGVDSASQTDKQVTDQGCQTEDPEPPDLAGQIVSLVQKYAEKGAVGGKIPNSSVEIDRKVREFLTQITGSRGESTECKGQGEALRPHRLSEVCPDPIATTTGVQQNVRDTDEVRSVPFGELPCEPSCCSVSSAERLFNSIERVELQDALKCCLNLQYTPSAQGSVDAFATEAPRPHRLCEVCPDPIATSTDAQHIDIGDTDEVPFGELPCEPPGSVPGSAERLFNSVQRVELQDALKCCLHLQSAPSAQESVDALATVGHGSTRSQPYDMTVADNTQGATDEVACYRDGSGLMIPNTQVPIVQAGDIAWKRKPGGEDWILGSGTFGCVQAAYLRSGGGPVVEVAVKKYIEEDLDGVIREAKMMMFLDDTGVFPKFFGCVNIGSIHQPLICLISELFGRGTTLLDLIKNQRAGIRLGDKNWLNICVQLAEGLGKIHGKNVIFSDLKGNNVLVDLTYQPVVKYIDLGLSTFGQGETYNFTAEDRKRYPHIAPEVKYGQPTSFQSDIWSLGVLLSQIAFVAELSEVRTVAEAALTQDPRQRVGLDGIIITLRAISACHGLF